MATGSSIRIRARAVLQQCISAKVQTKPADADGGTDAEFVQIGRGLVIYICFMKDATSSIVDQMVKSILEAKLSRSESGKRISVLDLPGDVLIVPQATLGGRLRGKAMQFHGNIDKTLGEELYQRFISLCQETINGNTSTNKTSNLVKYGTYNYMQEVFSLESNTPLTHVLDF